MKDTPFQYIVSGYIFISLGVFTLIIYQILSSTNASVDGLAFWIGFLFLILHSAAYLLVDWRS